MQLEVVDCLLCGSTEYIPAETLHWKGKSLHYVVCETCGLKYMRRRPTSDWLARFYREEFWQVSRPKLRKIPNVLSSEVEYTWEEEGDAVEPGEFRPVAEQVRKEAWRAERIWNIVSPHVSLTPRATVVEFGAGFGQTLRLFREKTGCRVLAVEPSDLSREHIASHDITPAARTMEEFLSAPPSGKIDLAIMSHVLENTNDPLANLKTLCELLADEGRIFIDTCNYYYNNAINPYHPFIFSPETLNSLLRAAGFAVLSQKAAPHPMEQPVITDQPTAIYIATVAAKGETKHIVTPPPHPVIASQKAGLELLHAFYQASKQAQTTPGARA